MVPGEGPHGPTKDVTSKRGDGGDGRQNGN